MMAVSNRPCRCGAYMEMIGYSYANADHFGEDIWWCPSCGRAVKSTDPREVWFEPKGIGDASESREKQTAPGGSR